MTGTLFEPEPEPAEMHLCDTCPAVEILTLDGLRVLGWDAYDGVSLTDKTLSIRICPDCKREGKK